MKNKNILIVIDNGIIGLDIKKQLNEFGYNSELMNPASKEKLKETLNKGFQLMIIEKSIYDEGIDYAVRLAREYHMPAIYLSTDNETENIVQDGFRILMMPFGKDDLKEIVKITLGDN
jgi:DNA-binding NtrC family response regulator